MIYGLVICQISSPEKKLLTRNEERDLAKKIKRGCSRSREELITRNMRLVIKIATDYKGLGLDLDDLISEGSIGLMRAAKDYNPDRGAKFSTYAAWWIKQAIKRALANQSRTIRLPMHIPDQLRRLNRVSRLLADELGREPSDEELAIEMEMTPTKVRMLRESGIQPLSLDKNGDSNPYELVEDEAMASPSAQIEQHELHAELTKAIQSLDARERTVISMRFGIFTDTRSSLLSVGKKLKISQERVRQIQEIAICKIRRLIPFALSEGYATNQNSSIQKHSV